MSASKTLNGLTLYDGREATPGQRMASLKVFRESKDFECLNAEFRRALALLEGKIFSTKTDSETRDSLVRARQEIINAFAPEKLVQDGIQYAQAEIDRRDRDAQRRSG